MRAHIGSALHEGAAGAVPIPRLRRPKAGAAPGSSDARSARTRGISVRLDSPLLVVEAGGRRELSARVCNLTGLVDNFRVEVLGPAADWSTITPEAVGLLPGEELDVAIEVSPPRHSELSGPEIPFAIRITSEVPPNDSGMAQGMLRVLRWLPDRTSGSRGRRRAADAVAALGVRILRRR